MDGWRFLVAIHQLIAIYSRPENHQSSPTIRMGKEKSMKHVPFDFPTNPMIPTNPVPTYFDVQQGMAHGFWPADVISGLNAGHPFLQCPGQHLNRELKSARFTWVCLFQIPENPPVYPHSMALIWYMGIPQFQTYPYCWSFNDFILRRSTYLWVWHANMLSWSQRRSWDPVERSMVSLQKRQMGTGQ